MGIRRHSRHPGRVDIALYGAPPPRPPPGRVVPARSSGPRRARHRRGARKPTRRRRSRSPRSSDRSRESSNYFRLPCALGPHPANDVGAGTADRPHRGRADAQAPPRTSPGKQVQDQSRDARRDADRAGRDRDRCGPETRSAAQVANARLRRGQESGEEPRGASGDAGAGAQEARQASQEPDRPSRGSRGYGDREEPRVGGGDRLPRARDPDRRAGAEETGPTPRPGRGSEEGGEGCRGGGEAREARGCLRASPRQRKAPGGAPEEEREHAEPGGTRVPRLADARRATREPPKRAPRGPGRPGRRAHRASHRHDVPSARKKSVGIPKQGSAGRLSNHEKARVASPSGALGKRRKIGKNAPTNARAVGETDSDDSDVESLSDERLSLRDARRRQGDEAWEKPLSVARDGKTSRAKKESEKLSVRGGRASVGVADGAERERSPLHPGVVSVRDRDEKRAGDGSNPPHAFGSFVGPPRGYERGLHGRGRGEGRAADGRRREGVLHAHRAQLLVALAAQAPKRVDELGVHHRRSAGFDQRALRGAPHGCETQETRR
jgi:hypothetical protein